MLSFHHNTKSHVTRETTDVKEVTYHSPGLSYNKLVSQLMTVYHILLDKVELKLAQRHVLMDQISNYTEPREPNHSEVLLMPN